MEYAIADWALAQAALYKSKSAKDTTAATEDLKIYRHFDERSRSYKNFFDRETGFMRGKDSKGQFRTPLQSVRFHSQGRRLLRGQRMAVHMARTPRL